MCGIAGLITADPCAAAPGLAAMLACQRHRGPDDEGAEQLTLGPWTAAMGQRRLAIIDLSPLGHQPMVNPETGDVLIFNGEAYNFRELRRQLEAEGVRFRSQSDTEGVLYALRRHGPGWLSRTAGMFALAFLMPRERRLILARDPMGQKPLYLARPGGGLVFASEVRAILATGLVPPDPDPAAVAGLLAFGAVQEPRTFFRGIEAFPPGCWRAYDLRPDGTIAESPVTRHWSFPAIDPTLDEPTCLPRIRETLDTAVRDHLESDVPVGVFLSSGLDSTIVAALAARHTPRLRTLTVALPDHQDLSEGALAARTADLLGVEHTQIDVPSEHAEHAAVRWFSSLDQPSIDGLNTFIISDAVRRAGIVVALSGLGGDELFGGYPAFADVPRALRLNRVLSRLPANLRGGLFALAARGKPPSVRDKAREMGALGPDPLRLYLHRRRTMSDRRLAALGLRAGPLGLDRSFVPADALAQLPPLTGDPVADVSRLEASFYMRNMLLRDTDQTGMAHSLEIRVPMLDPRVMAHAFATPGRVRLPGGVADKHLLRRAFAETEIGKGRSRGKLLRAELLDQKKRGFTVPIRRWLAGPLRPLGEDAVATTRASGLLDSRGVDAAWSAFLAAPDTQAWSGAFALVVLGVYLQGIRDRGRELSEPRPRAIPSRRS